MKQCVKPLLMVILLLSGVAALAQSQSGRLVGTVTDPSGAAIPGATVRVTDFATNRVVTTESQSDGN